MVKIGQNFGTVVAVVSTVMSPFMLYMGGITSFVNSAFAAFNTPIFVCLICGFFWKKLAIAAKIVMPVHVVLYFILQFGLRHVHPGAERCTLPVLHCNSVRIRHAAHVGDCQEEPAPEPSSS